MSLRVHLDGELVLATADAPLDDLDPVAAPAAGRVLLARLPNLQPGRLRRVAELLGVSSVGDDEHVLAALTQFVRRRGVGRLVLARRRSPRAAAPQVAHTAPAASVASARPRIVAVSWLEGDREVGDVVQWVNLDAARAEVWRRRSPEPRPHVDRFGDAPRARIRFDRPGAHPAEVWLEAHADNVSYLPAETARNPKFVLDESHLDFVTGERGTVDVAPFRLPPAGLNRYRLAARDLDGNVVTSGWLTAWRRLWIVPVRMQGLPEPNLAIAQKTHRAVGIDFVPLERREIPYATFVPSRLVRRVAVPEPADLAIRAQINAAASDPELGRFVKGVGLVDTIAIHRDEVLQASIPPGGATIQLAPFAGQSVPLLFRAGEDDRSWLLEATARGPHGRTPLPPEQVVPVARRATDVQPGDFPLAPHQASAVRVLNPTNRPFVARLRVRVFAGSRAGFQTEACMVLAARVNLSENSTEYVGTAAAHELGHGTFAAAGPEGTGNASGLEPHAFRYYAQGGHCHNPYEARRRHEDGTFLDRATLLIRHSRGAKPPGFPDPACLMFGFATRTPETLCPHCVRVQRRTDLSAGFAS